MRPAVSRCACLCGSTQPRANSRPPAHPPTHPTMRPRPTNTGTHTPSAPRPGTCASGSSLAPRWARSSWCRSGWRACWATSRRARRPAAKDAGMHSALPRVEGRGPGLTAAVRELGGRPVLVPLLPWARRSTRDRARPVANRAGNVDDVVAHHAPVRGGAADTRAGQPRKGAGRGAARLQSRALRWAICGSRNWGHSLPGPLSPHWVPPGLHP